MSEISVDRNEYNAMRNRLFTLESRNRMDSEDKFWISIWSLIAVTVLLLAAFITYFNHAEVMVFKELAEKSPENSLQIACAQDAQTSQTSTACLIYLSKGK